MKNPKFELEQRVKLKSRKELARLRHNPPDNYNILTIEMTKLGEGTGKISSFRWNEIEEAWTYHIDFDSANPGYAGVYSWNEWAIEDDSIKEKIKMLSEI